MNLPNCVDTERVMKMGYHNKIVLKNSDPTDIDAALFNHSGYILYRTEQIEGLQKAKIYKYVKVYVNQNEEINDITEIQIDKNNIDYNDIIVFNDSVEGVFFTNNFKDQEMLLLILAKTIELGWNQFSTHSQKIIKAMSLLF